MLLDDLQRLRESGGLLRLLSHYTGQIGLNPDAWFDRLMQLDGADPVELTRWHGELIACGWLEQNTGHAPPGCQRGVVLACYRMRAAGRRALREAQSSDPEMDVVEESRDIEGVESRPPKRGSRSRKHRTPEDGATEECAVDKTKSGPL
jgi:hypothetical protein